MPGILHHLSVSDETRREHDRHAVGPVAAVLGLIAAYACLCTDLFRRIGIPSPATIAYELGLFDAARRIGLPIESLFGREGGLDSSVQITYTHLYSHDTMRLVFCAVLAAAFLSAYYLPVRFKRQALVGWTLVGIAVLYSFVGAAGLVLAHAVVYLTLHPRRGSNLALAALAGALGWLTFVPIRPDPRTLFLALALPAAAAAAYRFVWLPLLALPRVAAVLRTVVVQSPVITVFSFAVIEGATGDQYRLRLGILLFFWQWARVIMYYLDHQDGHVPHDVSFARYLSVFVSPGVVPVWQWGIAIGQGYRYVEDNFLSEPKNRIVMSGVRLMLLAFLYVVLWGWVQDQLVRLGEFFGVAMHEGDTYTLVDDWVSGTRASTLSVLLTTFVDLIGWVLHWGGIFHFKVAVWRICGYKFDRSIDRPWRATNLVRFWPRISYHYREFLVRAFYYPVFFRFFKKQRGLRIVAATMAAAGLGNLVWGHLSERMYFGGMKWEGFGELRGWPYFLLLGAGISLTELYLLRKKKKRRRPWTPGPRIVLDVVCAYAVLQFFALIHVFRRASENSSVWDVWHLFLRGLGLPF